MEELENFAGIEYHGIAGSSLDCLSAIDSLLQFRPDLSKALILSYKDETSSNHALLFYDGDYPAIAIKSGFSSGYRGTGPSCFSKAISMMMLFGIDIEEVAVTQSIIDQIDYSALSSNDIDTICKLKPIRPKRLYDYVYLYETDGYEPAFTRLVTPILPYGLVHDSINDLAKSFYRDSDNALLKAYRRLEEKIWALADLKKDTKNWVSAAFAPDKGVLTWSNINSGEKAARMNLFQGVFGAYRNVRAHKECKKDIHELIREFLLINELFFLLDSTIMAPPRSEEKDTNN